MAYQIGQLVAVVHVPSGHVVSSGQVSHVSSGEVVRVSSRVSHVGQLKKQLGTFLEQLYIVDFDLKNKTYMSIEVVESVQRYFTWRLPGLGQLNYPERLIATGLEPLELRRLHADLRMTYKISNKLLDLESTEFFNFATAESTTRGNCRKMIYPTVRNECRKSFLSFRVIKSWNALKNSTVGAPNLAKFKKELKTENLYRFLWSRF